VAEWEIEVKPQLLDFRHKKTAKGRLLASFQKGKMVARGGLIRVRIRTCAARPQGNPPKGALRAYTLIAD